MTISELINGVSASRATVYKKIKAAGYDLDKIRDETGNILPEYVQPIANLFNPPAENKQLNTDAELETMRIRLEAAEQRINDLTAALEAARADAAAWRERASADAARVDRLLVGANTQHGFMAWLRRIGGKGDA